MGQEELVSSDMAKVAVLEVGKQVKHFVLRHTTLLNLQDKHDNMVYPISDMSQH